MKIWDVIDMYPNYWNAILIRDRTEDNITLQVVFIEDNTKK